MSLKQAKLPSGKGKLCTYQNVAFDPITRIPKLGPVCNKPFRGQTFCGLHKHNSYLMSDQWIKVFNATHQTH